MDQYLRYNNHSASNKNFDHNPINYEYQLHDENAHAQLNNFNHTLDIK